MTFGPLFLPPDPPQRRNRGAVVPGSRDCLVLAALLLCYPDDDLVSCRAAALEAACALPLSEPAGHLVEFCVWFLAVDPDDVRVDYVRTFDHQRRNSLSVTYATNGDTRRRGDALLAFKRLYRQHGYDIRDNELPDYLPTVLQFAAQAPAAAAAAALAMARPGTEVLARSLAAAGSPWAPLAAAVLGCFPPLDREAKRQLAAVIIGGPPAELVGVTPAGPFDKRGLRHQVQGNAPVETTSHPRRAPVPKGGHA